MAHAIDVVAVFLAPHRFGIKRWKAPVLAFDEQAVGRSAAAGIQGKELALAPDIEAVAIHAEGEVEIKRRAGFLCLIAQAARLLVALPLNIKMVVIGAFVVVVGSQDAVAAGAPASATRLLRSRSTLARKTA